MGTGIAVSYVDGNQGGFVLDATGNWFGTASEAEIRARILDNTDDLANGPVAFKPFLTGPNPNAPAVGTPGDDQLVGSAAADRLFGFEGKDAISGAAGDDILWGGLGKDRLTGGPGEDDFVIEVVKRKEKPDKIDDFVVGEDLFVLDQGAFERLKVGELKESQFCRGQSRDKNDFIIYHRLDGKLYYDADGSKENYDPIKFAVLDDRAKLSANDFEVI
jgi:Ca2+-binding RTX toxin-like protein